MSTANTSSINLFFGEIFAVSFDIFDPLLSSLRGKFTSLLSLMSYYFGHSEETTLFVSSIMIPTIKNSTKSWRNEENHQF